MNLEELRTELLEWRSHDVPRNLEAMYELAYSSTDYDLAFKCKEIAAHKAKEWKTKDSKRAEQFHSIYKQCLKFLAIVDFDCYCQYLEFNREPSKRFYLPRRKQLRKLGLIQALQDLADGKLDLLGISMPPGTGKTTLAIFFLTWFAGKYPDDALLSGSHSSSLMRGVYDECLRILDPQGEYLWSDIFSGHSVAGTDAKNLAIDIDKGKRFSTLQFTSVGAGNAGKVRAMKLLYCDDLISGIEEAMSKERLDKLWQLYTDDLRQRKMSECPELHIATRWSVNDVIGRLQEKFGDSDRARFIAVPALDKNDESNFDYTSGVGFTTEFYREMRDTMDDVSWKAIYMNEPIEREGLLYPEQELRRYFRLPSGEPDGIISICDTKDKGKDYAFLPVAYVYGQDYYIADCVCDNHLPEVIEPRIVNCLLKNKVQMSRFEHNNAGGRIAKDIQEEITKQGGITKITTKYTTSNKETKIIVNAGWVKAHCLFKDSSLYKPKDDYGTMMSMLCSYTIAGKNKHDDVPDGMAMLSQYAQSFTKSKAEVFSRYF